ncbi:NAD(P)H-binding protein [Demequina sp. TTPB684]|uniref:NAD(P)-dependent oxidoreductase n=1 Tax=unclassified Demequina TaxID=2620311 RepID=UPI001CF13D2B|nr:MULTISPECIES: NAD(P)H-binding protein [unclassified Demequina]MCB2411397.1 NAD(P)H-binding protein [Demequina sp. TTPB684]UPU87589.1 NAD(P)H-binding protein [Demequina sp. TMPB413]
MASITVIGGTGYAGAAIVAEAAARVHRVTAVARSVPMVPVDGVTYLQGSALSGDVRARAFEGADAVVTATSPRGDMVDHHLDLASLLAESAIQSGARLIVVGGFSSLRPAPGAARFIEGEVPEEYRAEAQAGHAVYESLLAADPALDWTFVSPAATFGAFAPGEATGRYRLGGEVAIFDEDGKSFISAPDFAAAILDLIDNDEHHREHVSVVG